MDTSISQQDTISAQEILKRLVCTPGHIVTEANLRATGVDVDLLESMYDTNLKPYLDYLHGYERLEVLDPLKGRRREFKTPIQHHSLKLTGRLQEVLNGKDGEFLWDSLLAHCGMLGRRTKARLVIQQPLYSSVENSKQIGFSQVTVAFYLTRSDKWLFWYVEGNPMHTPYDFRNERLSAHDTVREAWEAFCALVPDHFTTDMIYSPIKHLPLLIEQNLKEILKETIKEREKRLDSLKSSLDSAERRTAIIHM